METMRSRLVEIARPEEQGFLAPAEAPRADDPIICNCLQVSKATLQECIRRGCATQEELARETGVTTVCGGCAPQVAELIGGATGVLTRIIEVREILPSVRSFRFAPVDPRQTLTGGRPGQHVIVSALINGVWVSRPYSLTSPAGERRYQEITVKLEARGVLSRWLFRQRPEDFHPIRVMPPQGNFEIDLNRTEPIVFLAGGIGVTPVISLVRTLAATDSRRLVHIDYSARERDGFAFRKELIELARAANGISVHFRATDRNQRLQPDDLATYQWRFPRGRYYICGPQGYETDVRTHLAQIGVDERRVQVEVFTSSRPASATENPERVVLAYVLTRILGFVLLALYLGQGFAGVHWPWLEALQAGESYRRWSGAVLLAFVASQWALPILRIGDRPQAAPAYRWHRWSGAFAPAFFYAHASWIGFGYLLALGSVYLANALVGLTDKSLFRDPAFRERYGKIWLVPHVALACLTVGLTLYHIFVVFAFK